MRSQLQKIAIPLSFLHTKLRIYPQLESKARKEGSIPSFAALTATKRSKFSSTNIRMASERASIEDSRWEMPAARSWYVALGCTADKNALGSNDFDVMRIAASIIEL